MPPETAPRPSRGDPAFIVRVISSAVLAPAALLAAWAGGWVFAAAVAVTAALMVREWIRISDPAATARAWAPLGVVVAAGVLAGAAHQWGWGLTLFGIAGLAAVVLRWRRGSQWRAAFGALYVGIPCLALVWVRETPPDGFRVLLCLFAIVWSADIGAYLAGRLIGGPKFAPWISPNKTWSGCIAAVLLGGAAGGAGFWLSSHPVFMGVGLGLVTGIAAVSGDLLESVLKRRFGVKDAGSIIPGHGGVLDRMDALMGAVLMFAALIWYVTPLRAAVFGG